MHAINYFKSIQDILKEDYQKVLKKVTSFFLPNPVPFNRQNYQKEKEPGTSDQPLFRLWNKFRKIPLSVTYYLTKFDDVVFVVSSFWVILKIKSVNLCKVIYGIINYSTSICPFESRKCGKGGKKLQKFEYLENKKNFLDEIKNIFHTFGRPIIWWKNKHLLKNSTDNLKVWNFNKML